MKFKNNKKNRKIWADRSTLAYGWLGLKTPQWDPEYELYVCELLDTASPLWCANNIDDPSEWRWISEIATEELAIGPPIYFWDTKNRLRALPYSMSAHDVDKNCRSAKFSRNRHLLPTTDDTVTERDTKVDEDDSEDLPPGLKPTTDDPAWDLPAGLDPAANKPADNIPSGPGPATDKLAVDSDI